MATVTGLTAERMQEIIDKTIVDADIIAQHLILTLEDGSTIDAGAVGPAGKGSAFPAGATDGDLFVRTDIAGDPLYKYTDGAWTIFTGGGVSKGSSFPVTPAPTDGDLFVRTDQVGDPMYKLTDGVWERQPRMGALTVPQVEAWGNTISCPHGNYVVAPLNGGEIFDTDNMHDLVTNNSRITIKTPGMYLIRGSIQWPANANGDRWIDLLVNGGSYSSVMDRANVGGSGGMQQEVVRLIPLAAGDYVEVRGYQDSGVALNMGSNRLQAIWLGGNGQTVDERGNPAVSTRKSASQSIPNAVYTTVSWDTEDSDTDGMHDTVTNNSRLVIKTPGRYLLTVGINWAFKNAASLRDIGIWKNGAGSFIAHEESAGIVSTTSNSAKTVTAIVDANAGDYFEVQVYQDGGGALDITNAPSSFFNATLLATGKTVTPYAQAAVPATHQSIPSAVWTAVALPTEVSDNDGMHDTVTQNDRIVIRTAGKYLITAMASFDINNAGDRSIWIGGSKSIAYDRRQAVTTAGAGTILPIAGVVELAVGDYVQMQVYQASGGALNLKGTASGDGDSSHLKVVKIGAPQSPGSVDPVRPAKGACAYNSNPQTVGSGGFVALALNTNEWDDAGIHDVAVNNTRFTVPPGMDGKWTFFAETNWTGGGRKAIMLRVDGGGYRYLQGSDGNGYVPGFAVVDVLATAGTFKLVAGDYIELVCVVESSAATQVTSISGVRMSCVYEGPNP